ncbi:hypothetical protein BDV18DRAFT_149451 [Aspergillus unguis]
MGLLSALLALFYILLVNPVYYVAFCAYFLLSLLASPFIYLGSLGFWIALLPFRALYSIKELLIYLGVASLAGAGAGLLLYFITTLTIDGLLAWVSSLSATAEIKPKRKKRAIEEAKYTPPSDSGVNTELSTNWGWGLDDDQLRKVGVASQTILEEESQSSEL